MMFKFWIWICEQLWNYKEMWLLLLLAWCLNSGSEFVNRCETIRQCDYFCCWYNVEIMDLNLGITCASKTLFMHVMCCLYSGRHPYAVLTDIFPFFSKCFFSSFFSHINPVLMCFCCLFLVAAKVICVMCVHTILTPPRNTIGRGFLSFTCLCV